MLLHLSRAPERMLRRVDLAERVLLTASGITRLLDGLERSGFVEKASCAKDARVSYAKISDDMTGHDQETVLELNYLAQVTPWLTVQPDIQYIVHPGGLVPNPSDPNGGTTGAALVLGARTTIAF